MNFEPTLEKLAQAQRVFLQRADCVDAEFWDIRLQPERWSTAEVVAHLHMVERSILGKADRILKEPPKRYSALQKVRLPMTMALTKSRLVRRKSPLPVDPQLLQEKEVMIAELRGMRERTIAFLQEIQDREVKNYYWPHPFLGLFNVAEWFEFIAAHQIRHEKQIREIVDHLPKTIATLPL